MLSGLFLKINENWLSDFVEFCRIALSKPSLAATGSHSRIRVTARNKTPKGNLVHIGYSKPTNFFEHKNKCFTKILQLLSRSKEISTFSVLPNN